MFSFLLLIGLAGGSSPAWLGRLRAEGVGSLAAYHHVGNESLPCYASLAVCVNEQCALACEGPGCGACLEARCLPALSHCLRLAIGVELEPRRELAGASFEPHPHLHSATCTGGDMSLWLGGSTGDVPFARTMALCGRRVPCLARAYPTLTPPCADCLTAHAVCLEERCALHCLTGAQASSHTCFFCMEYKCRWRPCAGTTASMPPMEEASALTSNHGPPPATATTTAQPPGSTRAPNSLVLTRSPGTPAATLKLQSGAGRVGALMTLLLASLALH